MYNIQLKSFVCVADCGSMTKAAELLYITPTALMKQMDQLEYHLGLKLFERSNRGVRLTPAGDSIYKDAKFVMNYSEKALARARELETAKDITLRVGTSILNPCKVFMDLWNKVNDRFPQFKIQVMPFEDTHNDILSVVSQIGEKFDFIVGPCDSSEWLSRCSFLKLGEYKKCIAVARTHRLAEKTLLRLDDLHGEHLTMVRRGDSAANDKIRDFLEKDHPEIIIEDAPFFYDINVFNNCESSGGVLLTLDVWADVHPALVTIPVEWDCSLPYGILYQKDPPQKVTQFLDEVQKIIQPGAVPA